MKKLWVFFLPMFLYANLALEIVNKIKEINSFKRKFVVFPKYCLFFYGNNNSDGIKKESKITFVNKNLIVKAILNDKICFNMGCFKKGDIVNGFRIVKFDNRKIVLKKENKKVIITLNNPIAIRIKK